MRRLTSPSPIVAHGSDRKTNSLPSVDFEESRCPHQLTSISPHFRSSCSLECSRSSARSPILRGNQCGPFNNVFKKYYFYQTVRMYSLRITRQHAWFGANVRPGSRPIPSGSAGSCSLTKQVSIPKWRACGGAVPAASGWLPPFPMVIGKP